MTSNQAMLILGLFAANWLVMATYVSLILHRGLAHKAIRFPGWFVKLVTAIADTFFIYVNPRVFVAEHRLHHAHADTEDDPDKKPGWSFWRYMLWSIVNPAGPNDDHVVKVSQDKIFKTRVLRLYSNPWFGVVCQFGGGLILPYLIIDRKSVV